MRSRALASRENAAHATGSDDWEHHWHAFHAAAASNPAQDFRRRLILRLLSEGECPVRLLDIGSGSGDMAQSLRAALPDVDIVGVELSRSGVELARAKVPDAVFLQRDLTTHHPPPAAYRAWATHAVCSEVLEHVDKPSRLLENVRAYLAPGCQLIVTVPGGPMTAYDRHIGHRRHFRPADVVALLRGTGYDVDRASGAGFPSFNLYRIAMLMLGERIVDVAESRTPSMAVRLGFASFGWMLRHNLQLSNRGWQIVATARLSSDAPTT